MPPVNLPFYARFALVLTSLLILGYLAIIGQEILAPLLFAFLFAIILIPYTNFLEKKCRLPRGLAAIISVVTLLIVVATVLTILGSQLAALINDWPKLKVQVGKSMQDLQNWVELNFNVGSEKQLSYIHNATAKMLTSTASVIGVTVITLSSTVLFYIFILLFTFFMLLNRRHLLRFLILVFKEKNSALVFGIVEQIQQIIKKYIAGLFLQMSIVSVIACSVFTIAGIEYAILLGLITGIFNLIPYIGIFSALLLSVLITFATAGTSKALVVIIVMVCIHLVDSNIIMPMVVGAKVKINALIVVAGIIIGEMMWGISGMFLCIPYIAIFKIIFDKIETLNPWGFLLGEEVSVKKKKKLSERLSQKE